SAPARRNRRSSRQRQRWTWKQATRLTWPRSERVMRLTRRAVLAMPSRASTWRYAFILMTLPPLTAAETPMRAQATCTGPLPTTTKPFGSNPILPRHFAIVDWRGKNSTAAKTTTIKPKPGNLTLQPAGESWGPLEQGSCHCNLLSNNNLQIAPQMLGSNRPALSSKIYDVEDFAAAQELFHSNRWTDGLPVVPPTEAAVEACLD